ncbi:MAG: hypothetical protein FWC24_06190, partial [Treponema sp.]|nr:hypothetical protein [Treponema sp.]
MRPEDPALPLPRIGRSTLVPALICAGLSVILIRAGFLTFFFLVPLGICAVVFGPGTAWLGFACAAVSNSVWSLGFLMRNGGLQNAGLNSLYFAVLALGFTWIMAGASGPPVRTLYRF